MIFYNQKPHLMTFSPGQDPVLLFANDDGKKLADSFIRGVTADARGRVALMHDTEAAAAGGCYHGARWTRSIARSRPWCWCPK